LGIFRDLTLTLTGKDQLGETTETTTEQLGNFRGRSRKTEGEKEERKSGVTLKKVSGKKRTETSPLMLLESGEWTRRGGGTRRSGRVWGKPLTITGSEEDTKLAPNNSGTRTGGLRGSPRRRANSS